MLFKNTLKTFSKKKIQLLAIGIIIFLSSFIYATMFYAIDGLRVPMEKMVEENKQEHFSVEVINGLNKGEMENLIKDGYVDYISYSLSDIKVKNKELYYEIMNKRKEIFEEKYSNDYDLELREFKDLTFENQGEGHKIRIFKDGKNINLSLMVEGKKPASNDEIAINNVYAEKNNLNIGDKFTLDKKEYIISGFVIFPDFNMPIMGNDFIIDNSKITVGLVTDEEYESLVGKNNFYFAGMLKENINLEEFKGDKFKYIDKNLVKIFKDEEKNENTFITDIVITKNQLRSGAIYEELRGGQYATLGISLIIASIAVMMVAIVTYKILRNEKTQIGVLKALGYSKYEIATPYIMILLIISLPMLILGYFGGMVAAEPMKNFYLEFYLIPDESIKSNLYVLITAIIVPLIFTVGLSALLIMKMLSKKAVNLIKVGENNKVGVLNKIVNNLLKKCKVQTRYKYSFIFRNTGKFLAFFIGISFSSMLIIMGFMMSGFFDKMTVDFYESVDYKYEGYLDLTKEFKEPQKWEEKFLSIPNGIYEDEVVSIKGLEPNNKLYNLYNKKNENITEKLEEGVIVNQSFSISKDVKKGDSIELEINNESYTAKVVEVSKDYGEGIIYFNREELSSILTEGKDIGSIKASELYNGVYSEKELNKEDFSVIINKDDIIEQSAMMQGFMKVAIYGMLGAAMFIAVLILYVLTTLTIEDNYYSISLLKVMGYSKKEVNSMMLNSYLVYAIISYLINVPITILMMKFFIGYMGSMFNMVFPFELGLYQGVFGLIIVIVIFMLGSYAAKKRITKVSLQEILKAYRE